MKFKYMVSGNIAVQPYADEKGQTCQPQYKERRGINVSGSIVVQPSADTKGWPYQPQYKEGKE